MEKVSQNEAYLLSAIHSPDAFTEIVDEDPDYDPEEKYVLAIDSKTLQEVLDMLNQVETHNLVEPEQRAAILALLSYGGWGAAHGILSDIIKDRTPNP